MNRYNRVWSFLKAKGFYIALALCITGAGAAAWLTAQNTLEEIRSPQEQITPQKIEEGRQWEYEDILQQQTAGEAELEKPSPSSSLVTAPESSSTTASAPSAQSAVPVPSAASGKPSFSLPVQSDTVLAPYSNGELVKNVTLNVWRTHDGVDYAAAKGTAVTAAAAGTVQEVRTDPLWGGVITVQHSGGYTSLYCGVVPETALKAGDAVTAGQVLGSVDTIAAEVTMEPHLHFAIQLNGKFTDPAALLPAPAAART